MLRSSLLISNRQISTVIPLVRRLSLSIERFIPTDCNKTVFGLRSYFNEGGNERNSKYRPRPRYDNDNQNAGRFHRQTGDRRNRYPNRSNYFDSRNKHYQLDKMESDPNAIEFQKDTLAKLVYVPKNESTDASEDGSTEVTLDQLLQENIIDKTLHKSIDRMGFPSLTSVQQKTIKPILSNEGDDIITRAKTGTGKTFAFLIPLFQHLINGERVSQYMVKSVIVAPTRDLALQIEAEIKKIHKNNYYLKKFQCVSLVGGTNLRNSLDFMYKNRPNIVIATPGRLIDILDRVGPKFFKHVDFKVLDEADRLLEIGFKQDLEHISETLNSLNDKGPKHIRTLLFSATLDEKVQNLANSIMNKDKCLFIDTIDKNEPEAHERIEQSLSISSNFADNIHAAIRHIKSELLESPKDYKAILFTPTVKFTTLIARLLHREMGDKVPILEFHGQVTQARRTRLVKQFKEDESGILICTDVAARGMDFPNVTEVLQIGVPTELANYIHRIGRTARSGKDGKSTIFLCENELPFITQLKAKKNIDIVRKIEFESTEEEREQLAQKFEFPEDLAESITSLISYYRACIKEYRLREKEMLPEIAHTYGLLLNEPDRKLPLSRNMIEKLGLSNNPIGRKMFEIESYEARRTHSRENHMNDENEQDNKLNHSYSSRSRNHEDGYNGYNGYNRRNYNDSQNNKYYKKSPSPSWKYRERGMSRDNGRYRD